MNLKDQYTAFLHRSRDLQSELFNNEEAYLAFASANTILSDVELMIETISERPESAMMKMAVRELNFAFLSASQCHYRHSYISTRLFLELMLGAIYFSAYEIKLRNWINNRQDIVWSYIIDRENGPLSKSFILAFSPEFSEFAHEFNAIAENVYRECSEYVHGNARTHAAYDAPLKFEKEAIIRWADHIDSIKLIITFCFFARYSRFLGKPQIVALEEIAITNLGENKAVRSLYNQ